MSVLLGGNDLPRRWQGRARFVVLDTDFLAGRRFFAAWQAWRDDPQRCARLVFIAIQPLPTTSADLRAAPIDATQGALRDALVRAWPPQTRDMHRLSFDAGHVELLLAQGDRAHWLRELVAEVDAFCVAGPAFDDARRSCKAFARLAAPGATLTAEPGRTEPDVMRAHLTSAGFELLPDQSITRARFAPGFAPRPVPARSGAARRSDAHALVIGAGLAGCASAWALAQQGWRSTLIEQHACIAAEASGNPAGLFHGIVHAQDGRHARLHRAAALEARNAVQAALDRGVAGSASGLLRIETTLDMAAMRALLRHLALPPEYVQALGAEEASARTGVALSQPGWFYPGGGWVDPAGLARAFLDRAGASAELRCGIEAHRLERSAAGWRVLDAHDRLISQAQTLVLANAGAALRLLERPDWPIDSVRGQISLAPASRLPSASVPIAGHGYLLPARDGAVVFGATAQRDDRDPAVRDADHALNLAQLARLLGRPTGLQPAELGGRTAWRCSAADRLPLIGAVPDPAAHGSRLDQPRFVPRLAGLHVLTALGSRGITWSALGARVLASWVTGAPAPIGASLLDAVDPARFVSREVRANRRPASCG